MGRITFCRIIIYIELLLFFFQHFFFSLYEQTAYLNVIINILLICLIFKTFVKENFKNIIYLLCVLFILTLYNLFYTNYIGLGACTFLISLWLHLIILDNVVITECDRKYIFYSFLIFLIFLNIKMNSLLIEFNTNTVAFSYLVCGIYLILLLPINKLLNKLLFFIIVLLTVQGIIISDSRTSLIAYFIFLLLTFCPSSIFQKKIFYNSISIILTFGSLIYVFFYLYCYNNRIDISNIFFFSSKTVFSGREIIWNEVLNLFVKTPFIGIGSNFSLRFADSTSIHNSILNLLVIYGVIIFLPTILILFKYLFSIRQYISNPIVKKSIVAYWTFLIVAYTETCLVQEAFASSLSLIIAYSTLRNVYKISNRH